MSEEASGQSASGRRENLPAFWSGSGVKSFLYLSMPGKRELIVPEAADLWDCLKMAGSGAHMAGWERCADQV